MTDAHEHASLAATRPAAIQADSELAPGTKIGRNVILERIGAGGMGVVFSAYDPDLDRRIAIKLLASSGLEDEARLRLLREARAMARLSHPNVVPVYDVGTVGGRVFVTMEFVEGVTLRAWLARESRPWTDVLETLRRAALGLQAAHEAGLIHRDFKPDNVMVGDDGRVRVLDFGLARGATSDDAPGTDPDRLKSVGDSALAAPLTSHGALLGTPAYMPPEQIEGAPVDARADQWSFCATLYEALYGKRPFEAPTIAASLLAMHNDGVPSPPDDSPVPRSIYAAIARGLEVEPSARHLSMAALLDALEPPAAPRSRARLTAVAAIGTAIVGATWWSNHRADQGDAACDARAAAASEVWSVQAQQAGADAFAASDVSFQSEAWTRSSDRIASYVESWNEEAGRACRASSPETAEADALRTKCLDDRLRRLRTVVDAFGTANDEVVRGAVETAFELPDLAPCADLPTLLTTVRPPEDPAEQAELARLEEELEAAAAHELSAEYEEGRKLAQLVLDQARTLGHDPFTAKALYTLSSIHRQQSNYEAARDGCIEAFELAASAHDDRGAAKAATELVFILGYELSATEAARAWTTMATTMVTRAGQNQQAPEAGLHNAIGDVAVAQGDYERAHAEFSEALEIWEALPADHPIERATVLSNLGAVFSMQGRYDEARDHHQRALQIREQTFGPEHPAVATSLSHLGIAVMRQGDLAAARELQERGLAIKRATLPHGHPSIPTSLVNLGALLIDMGELEDAITILEEALELLTASRGPDHPAVAHVMTNLATAYAAQGRDEKSAELFRRVVESLEKTLGPDHPTLTVPLLNLSEMMLRLRPEQATPFAERALAIRIKTLGPDHVEVGTAWSTLSRAHEANGRIAEALDAARKALGVAEQGEHDEVLLAWLRWDLGRLGWRLGDDRAEARRMVVDALAIMRKHPEREPDTLAAVEAWLLAHPRPD